jgi:hypothetical protein
MKVLTFKHREQKRADSKSGLESVKMANVIHLPKKENTVFCTWQESYQAKVGISTGADPSYALDYYMDLSANFMNIGLKEDYMATLDHSYALTELGRTLLNLVESDQFPNKLSKLDIGKAVLERALEIAKTKHTYEDLCPNNEPTPGYVVALISYAIAAENLIHADDFPEHEVTESFNSFFMIRPELFGSSCQEGVKSRILAFNVLPLLFNLLSPKGQISLISLAPQIISLSPFCVESTKDLLASLPSFIPKVLKSSASKGWLELLMTPVFTSAGEKQLERVRHTSFQTVETIVSKTSEYVDGYYRFRDEYSEEDLQETYKSPRVESDNESGVNAIHCYEPLIVSVFKKLLHINSPEARQARRAIGDFFSSNPACDKLPYVEFRGERNRTRQVKDVLCIERNRNQEDFWNRITEAESVASLDFYLDRVRYNLVGRFITKFPYYIDQEYNLLEKYARIDAF